MTLAERQCAHPTTEQILRLFSLAQRHKLTQDGQTIQTFDVQLTELQRKLLALLGVPYQAFRSLALAWEIRAILASRPAER